MRRGRPAEKGVGRKGPKTEGGGRRMPHPHPGPGVRAGIHAAKVGQGKVSFSPPVSEELMVSSKSLHFEG